MYVNIKLKKEGNLRHSLIKIGILMQLGWFQKCTSDTAAVISQRDESKIGTQKNCQLFIQ